MPVTAEEGGNGTQKLRQGKLEPEGNLEEEETLKRIKVGMELGVLKHACNPNSQEVEFRRTEFRLASAA